MSEQGANTVPTDYQGLFFLPISTDELIKYSKRYIFFYSSPMSYYFESGENINEAVKRMAIEQVEKGLKSFETEDRDEAIHDIRKRCKKIRALSRLVRDDMGKKSYKNANGYFRDLARTLSDLRDSKSMIDTLENLHEAYSDSFPDITYRKLSDALTANKEAMYERDLKGKNALEEAVRSLEKGKKKILDWPIEPNSKFGTISKSLKRVYKRGYKAFDEAYDQGSPEAFHEFRKRIKYLWYHTRTLKKMWKNLIPERAEEIHALANYLGDDHDLWVLKAFSDSVHIKGKDEKEGFEQVLRKESQNLRNKSYSLARLIYAEKPKYYVKRMGAYWEVFQ